MTTENLNDKDMEKIAAGNLAIAPPNLKPKPQPKTPLNLSDHQLVGGATPSDHSSAVPSKKRKPPAKGA